MYAHRIETTLDPQGGLHLRQLPFAAGERVEVIILRREAPGTTKPVFLPFNAVRLRGDGPGAAEMVIQDRS